MPRRYAPRNDRRIYSATPSSSAILGVAFSPLPVHDPESGLQYASGDADASTVQKRMALLNKLDGGFRTKFQDVNLKAYSEFYDNTMELMGSKDLKAFKLAEEFRYHVGLQAGTTMLLRQSSSPAKPETWAFTTEGELPTTLPLMQAVKHQFDRNRTLNPQRLQLNRTGAITCLNQQITWTGGTAPYVIQVQPGNLHHRHSFINE